MRHPRSPALPVLSLAALIALGACSSSDDDASTPETSTPGQGIAVGEPDPSAPGASPSGDTSMPAPGFEPMPISSEPGGDTRAVAGFWNATSDVGGERYFVIAENGLWTEYFLDGDGLNCYHVAGPQTLTSEDAATNAYSLADGRALSLVADADRTALTVDRIDEDLPTQTWPAVTGAAATDLPVCSG